jgi:hypothetical protein
MRNSECGATITPRPSAVVCETTGCEETELLAHVDPDDQERARILCPRHRVEYLREVYS